MEILLISLDAMIAKDYSFSKSGVVSMAADLAVMVVTTGILFTGQKVEM